jgi:Polyketide cyclase / dehydrase and lipid transport
MRVACLVTEYDDGRSLAFVPAADGAGPLKDVVGMRSVEPDGTGARVTMGARGRTALFGGRLELLVRWAARRALRRALRDVKAVLERRPAR